MTLIQEAYELFRCIDYRFIDAANYYREHGSPGMAEAMEDHYYQIKRWLAAYQSPPKPKQYRYAPWSWEGIE